jgi:hypothetical protein
MTLLNFGVSEFLGIFLIGLPCLFFFTIVLQKGILGLFEKYFDKPDRKIEITRETFIHRLRYPRRT